MTAPYYQDDLITLYHGDCLNVDEWLAADVLVTDPPYGVDWQRGATTWYEKGTSRVVKQEIERIANDSTPEARDAALAMWGQRPAIVFGSWRVPRPEKVQHRLIWHKIGRNPGPSNAPWYAADEEIYVLGKGFGGKPHQSVYPTTENRALEPKKTGHPTPKPVGLMESLIEKTEGVIADPFAGSGATLIAARNLSRHAIGVELEEKYCELIARRLAQQSFDFAGL